MTFSTSDFWNPQTNCTRVREDSLVDPITTQLNVFTTRDAPDHSFVLPEISALNNACLECELWQLTNPGVHTICQKCRKPSVPKPLPSVDEPLSPNKDALPRLEIPGDIQIQGLKRLRSVSPCSVCNASNCSGCFPGPTHLSFPSPASPEKRVKRSRAGRNSKLPIAALNRLQSWLDANKHNPYPTADTKRSLARECGITEKQVNTWFTNARARQMSAHQVDSGSEIEGAHDSDEAELQQYNMGASPYLQDSVQTEDFHRRTSVASQSRARTSRRGKKKDYRRNQNNAEVAQLPQTPLLLSPTSITSPVDPSVHADQEMWQCTFCLKALVPKSWRRHEDTQHRPKTQAARWTCMLHGPRLTLSNRTNSESVCAFCMLKNPSEEHFLQHHRIDECSRRDVADRTFYRPDHLRQHIKNFHNATLFDIVQARWKKAAETIAEGWTCGFCGIRLETWDKRETHISNHFKDGMTMASWNDFSETEKKTVKKKEKEKVLVTGTVLGGIRISNPFRRSHSSYHQPQVQSRPQHDHFANSFQQVSIESQGQKHIDGYITTPQCSSTGFQNVYASSTAPLGLGISQAPVLPAIPTMSPFMITQNELDADGNFIDWPSMSTTFGQQMQYPCSNTNTYGAGIAANTMQPDYTNTLGLGLYGNPMDYQDSWQPQQPLLQQNPHRNPPSPYVPQHFQRRQ